MSATLAGSRAKHPMGSDSPGALPGDRAPWQGVGNFPSGKGTAAPLSLQCDKKTSLGLRLQRRCGTKASWFPVAVQNPTAPIFCDHSRHPELKCCSEGRMPP